MLKVHFPFIFLTFCLCLTGQPLADSPTACEVHSSASVLGGMDPTGLADGCGKECNCASRASSPAKADVSQGQGLAAGIMNYNNSNSAPDEPNVAGMSS